MKRLWILAALALGACTSPAATAGDLSIYPDTTHHVVCYQVYTGDAALSCVYVPPDGTAVLPDTGFHVPRVPGSAGDRRGYIERT